MKTKMLVLGAFIAGILSAFFGGKAFAMAGNTAEISSGTWEICVNATLDTQSPDFSLDITKSGFKSQLVLGGGECKTVKLTGSSAYTVSLGSTMGASSVNYEVSGSSLTFNVANSLNNYLNAFGSVTYTTEGSGEETDYELLFSMPGTCYLNGNANVSGDTCKDGDGNPLTDKKYIDTGVALFSEGNAARDFEIYFTLDDYASTQPNNQGTLFNAKYENSSMLYPGFTLRMSGSNVQTMELTGRIGNNNTDADKAKKDISTASLKGKEMKIVRVGGLVSYSIDGGELIEFQNYQNFSRYFEQSAVFGASLQTNGTPQRYYDGTVSNIRIYLKKVGSIEFNANGGSGTMATIENKMIGTDVALPANTFTKNRAAFTGWNTEADGSGADYADEATVTITSEDTLTLYAQWEDIQVGSIEFNANGGTGTMTTIEDIPVGTNTTLPANTFTRTDYLFDGWNTESDGSGTGYADEATVTISSEDTLVLYAQWLVEPKGSIEFNANGGTGTMAAIENITLETNVTLPANSFTRTNHDFTGWNTEADGSGTSYADEATVTITSENTLTLYAQWRELKGKIEFNANGGTGTMSAIENITLGTNVTLPANTFTRTDYLFDGWNTEADGSGAGYADEATVTITSEDTLTLYAQWEEEPKGRIEFLANGGAGTMAAIENITLGTDVVLPANSFTRTGYDFNGWNTEANKSGTDYANGATITISAEGTLTLYAQWKEEKGGIIFKANGGTGTMAPIEDIEPGTDIVLPANAFTMAGCAFNGWNTKVNGSGVSYADGATVTVPTVEKITLYAQWDWGEQIATLKEGQSFNTTLKTLAEGGEVDFGTYDNHIKEISFVDTLPNTVNSNTPSVNVAITGSKPVYAYWVANDETIYINTEAKRVYASRYTPSMFSRMQALTTLSLSDKFDTSNTIMMSDMFNEASSLTTLTLPDSFDTSNVTDMQDMFRDMSSLVSLSLPESFDTSNVTSMRFMFYGMQSLTSLAFPKDFKTSKVTDMSGMFYYMRSLSSLTLPNGFDTSRVTTMSSMFGWMTSLTSLTFSNGFSTNNVTNMNNMFSGSSSLSSLTLPDSFVTSNATTMQAMFSNMTSLTSLSLPSSFNTSSVTNMSYMFSNMTSLTSLSLPSSFNTSNVTTMYAMFDRMTSLTSLSLPSSFNTSSVTNMSSMFNKMESITTLTLPDNFDTSNVTKMHQMFYNMTSLTTLTAPDCFVIPSSMGASDFIFTGIKRTAVLYATDTKTRSLWPGVLGN